MGEGQSPPEQTVTSQKLLQSTSRAFYLSLRVLPPAARQTMSLAYLLARCADSVCDGGWLPSTERPQALHDFLDCLNGLGRLDAWRDRVAAVDPSQGGEAALLHHLPTALQELEQLPVADQRLVIGIVTTLVQGMLVDLQRFADPDRLGSVWDEAELRRHLWAAAGCVGGFWTAVTCLHEPRLQGIPQLEELGVRLGNALQLTNVLRDVAGDLKQGRCYLPAQQLLEIGLQPADLAVTANESQVAPLYRRWLQEAYREFEASAQYVLLIPWKCWRLRLAALWPWTIGVATLTLLTEGGWLERKIKVSRNWVYAMLLSTSAQALYTPWLQHSMNQQLAKLRVRLQAEGSQHPGAKPRV